MRADGSNESNNRDVADPAPADEQHSRGSSCLEQLVSEDLTSNVAALAALVAITGVAFCIFHLHAAYFGQGESYLHNTTHVSFVMVLAFLLRPTGRSSWKEPLNAWFSVDVILIGLVIAVQ